LQRKEWPGDGRTCPSPTATSAQQSDPSHPHFDAPARRGREFPNNAGHLNTSMDA